MDRNREAAPDNDQQNDDTEQPLGRDERVSGWPASFEDVVRALHSMPRAPREKKPPTPPANRDKHGRPDDQGKQGDGGTRER